MSWVSPLPVDAAEQVARAYGQLPGSGKSTWARAWVSEDPAHRAQVNGDLLRLMLHGGFAGAEAQVTAAEHAVIAALLGRGVSVACSDTNLPLGVAQAPAEAGWRAGALVAVRDLTDVPLSTCLERNAKRSGSELVPEQHITAMHARHVAGRGYPLPLPEDPAGAPARMLPPGKERTP